RTNFLEGGGQLEVPVATQKAFSQVGITLKNIDKHVSYDTQENCDRDHQGKWNHRL
ncbi:Fis family transcriptional regulator, partial [Vibrio lentus]